MTSIHNGSGWRLPGPSPAADRRTASTILVIGNTGDPVTPYRDSVAMARALRRARLLTVKGFGHTEFFNPSTCASDYEFRYLTTGALPPPGTVCPQTVLPFPAPSRPSGHVG